MGKLLTAPLFLSLVALVWVVVAGRPRRHASSAGGLAPRTWGLLVAVTVGLGLLSMPMVSALLALTLEREYPYPSAATLASVDVVTVLSSGVSWDAGAAHSELDEASYVRTVVGTRAFQAANPRLFVVQGSLGGDEPEVMARLMAELAVGLGVPLERVALEPRSRNTRAHPVELLQIEGVESSDVLAVVTSAWHLPRAVHEFERYFDHIVPIPADYLSRQLEGNIKDWIPQHVGLERSTKVIHEWVGRLWYVVAALSLVVVPR